MSEDISGDYPGSEQDTEDKTGPSKTAIKKAFKQQQQLVRTLVTTSDSYLAQLGLSESTVEEIKRARGMTRGAFKRQVGFISKLMAEEDVTAASSRLEALQQPDAEANAVFHQLEQWRQQLLDNDDALQNRLVTEYHADRQQLRTLVRNAQREADRQSAPKSSRLLFRYLRQLVELNDQR